MEVEVPSPFLLMDKTITLSLLKFFINFIFPFYFPSPCYPFFIVTRYEDESLSLDPPTPTSLVISLVICLSPGFRRVWYSTPYPLDTPRVSSGAVWGNQVSLDVFLLPSILFSLYCTFCLVLK